MTSRKLISREVSRAWSIITDFTAFSKAFPAIMTIVFLRSSSTSFHSSCHLVDYFEHPPHLACFRRRSSFSISILSGSFSSAELFLDCCFAVFPPTIIHTNCLSLLPPTAYEPRSLECRFALVRKNRAGFHAMHICPVPMDDFLRQSARIGVVFAPFAPKCLVLLLSS